MTHDPKDMEKAKKLADVVWYQDPGYDSDREVAFNAIALALAQERLAERERCAKVAEGMIGASRREIAQAIRALAKEVK